MGHAFEPLSYTVFGICIEVQKQRGLHDLPNGNFRVCLIANFGQVPVGKKRLVHSPDRPALYGPHT